MADKTDEENDPSTESPGRGEGESTNNSNSGLQKSDTVEKSPAPSRSDFCLNDNPLQEGCSNSFSPVRNSLSPAQRERGSPSVSEHIPTPKSITLSPRVGQSPSQDDVPGHNPITEADVAEITRLIMERIQGKARPSETAKSRDPPSPPKITRVSVPPARQTPSPTTSPSTRRATKRANTDVEYRSPLAFLPYKIPRIQPIDSAHPTQAESRRGRLSSRSPTHRRRSPSPRKPITDDRRTRTDDYTGTGERGTGDRRTGTGDRRTADKHESALYTGRYRSRSPQRTGTGNRSPLRVADLLRSVGHDSRVIVIEAPGSDRGTPSKTGGHRGTPGTGDPPTHRLPTADITTNEDRNKRPTGEDRGTTAQYYRHRSRSPITRPKVLSSTEALTGPDDTWAASSVARSTTRASSTTSSVRDYHYDPEGSWADPGSDAEHSGSDEIDLKVGRTKTEILILMRGVKKYEDRVVMRTTNNLRSTSMLGRAYDARQKEGSGQADEIPASLLPAYPETDTVTKVDEMMRGERPSGRGPAGPLTKGFLRLPINARRWRYQVDGQKGPLDVPKAPQEFIDWVKQNPTHTEIPMKLLETFDAAAIAQRQELTYAEMALLSSNHYYYRAVQRLEADRDANVDQEVNDADALSYEAAEAVGRAHKLAVYQSSNSRLARRDAYLGRMPYHVPEHVRATLRTASIETETEDHRRLLFSKADVDKAKKEERLEMERKTQQDITRTLAKVTSNGKNQGQKGQQKGQKQQQNKKDGSGGGKNQGGKFRDDPGFLRRNRKGRDDRNQDKRDDRNDRPGGQGGHGGRGPRGNRNK